MSKLVKLKRLSVFYANDGFISASLTANANNRTYASFKG